MSNNVEETVIQLGKDGPLRGFMGYSLRKLREKGLCDGKIVVVQPVERGVRQMLVNQNREYNPFLRGADSGEVVDERIHVTSISRVLNPYTQYKEYIAFAESPGIRILVSSITGVGIEYIGTEKLTDVPPKSYLARLCQFLCKRYKTGLKGLILLPYELIGGNSSNLKKCALQYTGFWELEGGFKNQIENESNFYSTLVDRIVASYSRDGVEELTKQTGHEDKSIDTVEIFHLWVIGDHHEDKLPLRKAGYNVVQADDVHPYKKRKVCVLNGGHTSMALGACLYGLETISECIKNKEVSSFLKKCILEEIIPTIGDTEDNHKFGVTILECFLNPFIKHLLSSIALSSVSKFQVRALPTILGYKKKFGKYPAALTSSMAALIPPYRTDKVNDGEEIPQFMKTASVEDIMKRQDYWHGDLSEVTPVVQEYHNPIQSKGILEAYSTILAK